MLMNKEQIKEIIPHRDPFLLVDEIEEIDVGERVKAVKYVREEEYYFQGHFPEKKVMPGVLIIEALAQAGAVAVLYMPENKGKIAYLGGVNEAKFRRQVVPGDVLRLELEFTRLRSRAGTGMAKAYVGDQLACQCQLLFLFEQS